MIEHIVLYGAYAFFGRLLLFQLLLQKVIFQVGVVKLRFCGKVLAKVKEQNQHQYHYYHI